MVFAGEGTYGAMTFLEEGGGVDGLGDGDLGEEEVGEVLVLSNSNCNFHR